MFSKNCIVIDPNKSTEFESFLKKSGKTKCFWNDNAEVARSQVDETELDRMFACED